jgi:hypothetical protein
MLKALTPVRVMIATPFILRAARMDKLGISATASLDCGRRQYDIVNHVRFITGGRGVAD